MKLKKIILPLAAIAAAVFLSAPAFAAKGERRKNRNKAATPDFATLDKDANGSISKAEFAEGMKGQLDAEAAKNRFAELDKNKDDNVSKEELGTTEKKKREKKKKKKPAN